ncbi:cell division protein FtsQ [Caenibius tardaugens NBRC 16725]|uniref:Cell division protein FtsQ n=1 Tax=Caenibius tardaugens NBRC 16725 TaxID=1219035 RepID=U2ZVT3_9SPHN|nr:cell division protein FtsQ/DivIB [Caenibius tardaugens]AZI36803.1 FtsQ-type POTRA domain-containing protein [Caenibius tardaugens NBRC 16725]GAD49484.1 cell division protein FtsQ [Caenibius tardaugens NBRC 16725]
MAQTIKRGGKGVRRAAAARGAARKVDKAKAHTGSVVDTAMRWLPFTEEQLHRFFLFVIFAVAIAMAWVVASLAGLPALAHAQLAQFASNAGFEVRRVEVRGVEHMNELKVYERVLGERDRAMPLVDLDVVRTDLLGLSWVKDARVSRQLPDTLVVDIVEREPHAVLRKPNRLVLIDETGVELEPISAAAAKGRLIVSGPGAAMQVPMLGQLLDAAPALKPQVTEAEWIGNRRWNLTFKTGQVLALPQGEKPSATALIAFARLDGVNRLLGGKVAIFDMRAPERIYMRIPGRAAEAVKAGEERK